jgi:dsRNA-specific ribonuclease
MEMDVVSVPSPEILDPGPEFDDLALDPGLENLLAELGWDCREDILRRRWLRLASMHSSYLYERLNDLQVNASLLRMIGSLGGRWCRLYLLDEFIAGEPLASADEQSQAWAGSSPFLAQRVAEHLNIDQVMVLGRGEAATLRAPEQRSRTRESVTWQILGAMALLGGRPAVSKICKQAYRETRKEARPPTVNWLDVLNQSAGARDLDWSYRKSGPEHRPVFEAEVADQRGRSGKGTAESKTGARKAAAEDFVRRHLPAAVNVQTKMTAKRRQARPGTAALYPNSPVEHQHAIHDLRELFGLPRSADPLLTQALTHRSWTYEHQTLVNGANQRDNTALAHLGSVVADTLIAHDQASRVASQTMVPTEDDARIMPPPEQRLRDFFEDLQLRPGLLLSAGVRTHQLTSICAGAMQAVLGVAWHFRHESLLTRRPRPLDEWLMVPNGRLDPSTVLQELCAIFKIQYSIDYLEQGPDHERRFNAVLRFTEDTQVIKVQGPSAPSKTGAKHAAAQTRIRD